MEENPSSRVWSQKRGPTRKDHRFPEDETGDLIECSGKHCRSCTAGVIADCVAVCCCPCAVLSFFTLAFFKAPWMMGRRCLGLGKRNRRRKEKARKCELVGGVDGNLENGGVEVETLEIGNGFEDEEREGNLSARFEEERVWLELYQLGHLGFGRVSFTGTQQEALAMDRK